MSLQNANNWFFIGNQSINNVEVIFSIENEETLECRNLHICHETIIDKYAYCGINISNVWQVEDTSDIAADIFAEYKDACIAGTEEDFAGVYVTSQKKPVIVFTMANTIICEEYSIPDKGQSNAVLNDIASEIGATSFKRAVQ